ncbi:outer membrane lipoprotein chaperone LolA [candidate division KSB1 bacterium]|nr:outer membrane lipoprotein chaperone LolA [candidate division KSB1 bacterium]
MKMIKWLIVASFLVCYGHTVVAIDADEVIKRAKKKYEESTSLAAAFTQQFKWKLAGESQEIQGKIWLKDGDKFKIETADQTIVSDGKTIWTYSRANNQVIIDNLKNNADNMLPNDIFVKYAEDYRPSQLSEETVLGNDCYAILLLPKTQNAFIREMKVWVDKKDWITRKIQHTDINENMTSYTLSEIEIDPALPDNLFRFPKQQGVQEIDMR